MYCLLVVSNTYAIHFCFYL